MKIVSLHYDDNPENPCELGGWKVYSFNRRHVNCRNREDFFVDGKPTIGFRRKLGVGLAFGLNYYEHGLCAWYRHRWDVVDSGGVLVWENKPKYIGAKTYEDRAKDADSFLEMYTKWCNGEVYGFDVKEEVVLPCCGHTKLCDLESAWGFYGAETMAKEVAWIIRGDEVRFEGEAKHLSGSYDFVGQKPNP